MLVPVLRPGEIVILDRLPVHRVSGVGEAIEAAGARLVCLPAYSPDFNVPGLDPGIERAFAKLKALLRKAAARTIPELREAIKVALAAFTRCECRNYFAASGYDAF